MAGLFKLRQSSYSRFGDDLIISSNKAQNDFATFITKEVNKLGLSLNKEKFKEMKSSGRQQSLGLIINQKVNISRSEIKLLKSILHNAKKTGLQKQNKNNHPNFLAHIAGRITQVKAINPSQGEILWRKYIELIKESV